MLLFISIRQVLVILGIILLMRVIGKVMMTRRAMQEQDALKQMEAEKEKAKRNYGKTTIGKVDKNKISDKDFTDFEEVE